MNFFKKAKKGFTLVELVVVIAVIAILAAVSVGAYFGVTESANNSRAEQEAKQAYTQLQTKTLAGLDLGSSGTSVTLGNKGLTFNGIYDSNTLNLLGDLVFDEGVEYDVVALDTVTNVGEETTENATVYFLADNTTGSVVAEYMGYVPANLSRKYVKYLNLANGEFTKGEDITKTYVTQILPNNMASETLTLADFGATNTNKYNELTSSGKAATYKAFLYTNKDTVEDNILQFRKNGEYSVATNASAGVVKNIFVDWNAEKTTNKHSLDINGTRTIAYETSTSIPSSELELGTIAYPNNCIAINDNIYFTRIVPTDGTVYLNSITFYYIPGAAPEVPSSLTLNHENIETSDITSTIQLTADIEVEWTIDDENVATVDENGIVTPKTYGTVVVTATSVLNPDLNKTCTIIFKEAVNYKAGLISSIDDLEEGAQYVILNADRDTYLAGSFNLNANYHDAIALNSCGTTSFETNNLVFNFDNFTKVELLTLRKVTTLEDGTTTDSWAFEKTNGRFISSNSGSNLTDYYGTLKDEPTKYYKSVSYNISFSTEGYAQIGSVKQADKYIKLNKGYNRFGTYQLTFGDSLLLYKIGHEIDTTLKDIEISSTSAVVQVGKALQLNATKLPVYTDNENPIAWTSSNETVATIDSASGLLTAHTIGNTTVTATCDGKSDTIVIEVVAAPENGYYLINNNEDLEIGSKYVIVSETENFALSTKDYTYDSKINLNGAPITKNNDKNLINFDQKVSVAEFTLVNGTETGSYAFKLNDKYLTSVFNEGKNSYDVRITSSEVNLNSSWDISFNGFNAEIYNKDSNCETEQLSYYSNYDYFNLNDKDANNYNSEVRIYKLYGENQYLAHEHSFSNGTCTGCGEADPLAASLTTYSFSNYVAGTQYKENEEHKLDDNVTVVTTQCHFTSELRIYSSAAHNGYAIFKFNKNISKFVVNAGNTVDTLNIFVSNDGSNWGELPITSINVTSTSYKDYEIEFEGLENYKFFKIDVDGDQQVRLKSFSVIYIN